MFRLMVIPMMLVSGCATAIPPRLDEPNPICVGSQQARANVARDVWKTKDDALAVSGAALVEIIDAGCAK